MLVLLIDNKSCDANQSWNLSLFELKNYEGVFEYYLRVTFTRY